MADEAHTSTHRWYQRKYNIALAPNQVSRDIIYASGVSAIDNFINGGVSSFTPAALFALSEPGVWYDHSDLTTLFQDTAGTTPVTAAGQSVARINDKSGRGNNATQATAASRPILGRNPITGTRNLLTYTEQFDNAVWLRTGISAFGSGSTANSAIAPNGTMTADFISEDTSTGNHYVRCTGTAIGQAATFSVYVKAAGRDYAYIYSAANTAAGLDCRVNLTTGAVTNNAAGTTVTTENVGNGWWRVRMAMTGTYTGAVAFFAVVGPVTGAGAGIPSYTGDGTSGILLWGAQLETGSTATAYQKVVSQYDVTQSGVADAYYLAFDGVDDFLVTPTITPGIDKAQVFAGVRKLSDASEAIIFETSVNSNNNNGTLNLFAPGGISVAKDSAYVLSSRGTASRYVGPTAATYPAPITNVVTGICDIAAPSADVRVNGALAASSSLTQGTGNFLAYPIYIGRRAGTSASFNGRIYSLITRFGANLTAQQISDAETWVNGKTGAY